MFHSFFKTPFGIAKLKASESGITEIKFNISDQNDAPGTPNEHIKQAISELEEYFHGSLTSFNVSLDLSAGSTFYQRVWNALVKIPYGKTTSYKQLSIDLGNVKAIRAVGTANGRNPIPIIVPCHRVIGSDGSLTGYAYGLEMKQRLLQLESPETMGLQATLF